MCQPRVMMFRPPRCAELMSTMGPGSRKRRIFARGKSSFFWMLISLNPHVVGRRQIPAGVTGIYRSRRFHEHDVAFLLGEGFVLLALWNNEHFPRLQADASIP